MKLVRYESNQPDLAVPAVVYGEKGTAPALGSYA